MLILHRRLPVSGPGLSHISKEFEQELFSPSRALHFSGWGAFIRVRFKNIQRHSTDERQVLRRMVLATPGIVLMEHNVERPMQCRFPHSIRSDCFQNSPRRHAFGQRYIMNRRLAFVVSRLPFVRTWRGPAGAAQAWSDPLFPLSLRA